MSDLQSGMLVRHASLGVGKVVAVEPGAVHVFFATAGSRVAKKLRLQVARPLLTEAEVDGNAWLDGLSSFVLDTKTGRWGLPSTYLSREEAVARFRVAHPRGFALDSGDGAANGSERRERGARWRRAHVAFVDAFGRGEGERLLAAGDVTELVSRTLRVERQFRTLLKDRERPVLEEALRDHSCARLFFAALFDHLAAPVPERSRFEAFAATVAMLPRAGGREVDWTLVTALPFVAQPERQVLLSPPSTCEAAQRLGLDLQYAVEPNWETYQALLRSSERLLEELRPLGARDQIDVETFLYFSAARGATRPRPILRLVT